MKKTKKTIKINFKDFWNYFNPHDNFFLNILKEDYEVIISDNPDYVFYSVYDKRSPIYSKKVGGLGVFLKENFPEIYRLLKKIYYFKKDRWSMPVLKGNFVKIFFTVENGKPDMNKCDWAFSSFYDEELKNPRHLRIPSYFFNSLKSPMELVKKNLDIEKIKKEKTKFCAFIYTHSVPSRNRFFKRLCRYKKVESWGECLNNMGKHIPKVIDENPKKKSDTTMRFKSEDLLKPYKFIIVFENSSVPGYTSQTPVEAMFTKSIPIYWGNPLVHRDFNKKSFVYYNDFERDVKKNIPKIFLKIPMINYFINRYVEIATSKRMIRRIIEIDNNEKLWEECLKQPWYNDNKPSKYVDKEKVKKQLHKIFG